MAKDNVGALNVTLGATVDPYIASMRRALESTKTMDKGLKTLSGSMQLASRASDLLGFAGSSMAASMSAGLASIQHMTAGIRGLDKSLKSVALATGIGAGIALLGVAVSAIADHFSKASREAEELDKHIDSLIAKGPELRKALSGTSVGAAGSVATATGDRLGMISSERAKRDLGISEREADLVRQENEIRSAMSALSQQSEFSGFAGSMRAVGELFGIDTGRKERESARSAKMAEFRTQLETVRKTREALGLEAFASQRTAENARQVLGFGDPERTALSIFGTTANQRSDAARESKALALDMAEQFRKSSPLTRFSDLQRNSGRSTIPTIDHERGGRIAFTPLAGVEGLGSGATFGEQNIRPLEKSASLLEKIEQHAKEQRDLLRILVADGSLIGP